MRPHLVTAILALAVLGGFTLGNTLAPLLAPPVDSAVPTANPANAMRVELMIYRNGELVYYDPDDPAVNNFALAIAELLAPGLVSVAFTNTAGTTSSAIHTNIGGTGEIAISDDTQATFTRSMTDIPTGTTKLSAPLSISYTDNIITASASITVSSAMNVTWVGLYAKDQYNGLWLVFADQINPAISLNANDTITVVYKIILP